MARKLTPAQQATLTRLIGEPGVVFHREAWDGRTLLLGVAFQGDPGQPSKTRMYRVPQDGKEQGV